MRLPLLLLLSLASALAQPPPTPNAVLVAGATPAVMRATRIAMQPQSIALAPDGAVFLADNRHVWLADPAGLLHEIAGPWETAPQGLSIVTAIAADARGNLYVAEVVEHRIWKRSPDGAVTAIDLGNSTAMALAADASGNLYFSDTTRVWKLAPDGSRRLVAGGLIGPGRLAVDRAGVVYINDASAILQVTSDGAVRQVRARGGPTVSAVAVDASGNLYAGFDGQIARVAPDGSLQPIAPAAGCAPAIRRVADLALDSAGNIVFADPASGRVRRFAPGGPFVTVAGGDGGSFGGDGGLAVDAFLAGPSALAFDPAGNLYVVDRHNHRVRRIDPSGRITTVAGSGPAAGEDPPCVVRPELALSETSGLASDPEGNLYIADTGNHRVLQLSPEGALTAVASADAPAGMAFGYGNLYFVERDRIRYRTPDGAVQTFYEPLPGAAGLALDNSGNLFAGGASLVEIAFGGHLFFLPGGDALASGATGEIYSAGRTSLSRLDPDCAVTPLAGGNFQGVAVAPNGDLYVSSAAANRIWRIPARPAGGRVPLSLLPNASVVNGATRRPRTIEKRVPNRFGEITIFEPVNENVAPGELVAILGQCLGPLRFIQGPADGVEVRFNGIAAPVLSVTPNQLMAAVPYEVAGAANVHVDVRYGGQSAAVELETAVASVGIFPVRDAAYARGATASLLVTGTGQTDPPGITGQVAAQPAPRPVATIHVKIGGVAAEVLSAASEPGTIGVTRVTFRIPQDLATGSSILTIIAGPSSDSIPVRIF